MSSWPSCIDVAVEKTWTAFLRHHARRAASRFPLRLNPKKDASNMRTDSSHARTPIEMKVEDGIAIFNLNPGKYKLTPEQIEVLDGPMLKRVHFDTTGSRAGTSSTVSERVTIADYDPELLKAFIDRADKIALSLVRSDREHTPEEIDRLATAADGDRIEDYTFVLRILTDDPAAVGAEIEMIRPGGVKFTAAWPTYAPEPATG
jgi:hypothetical protein